MALLRHVLSYLGTRGSQRSNYIICAKEISKYLQTLKIFVGIPTEPGLSLDLICLFQFQFVFQLHY